jgi:hypothetical protein
VVRVLGQALVYGAAKSVATVNRTRGLKIFSLALSQLSYCDCALVTNFYDTYGFLKAVTSDLLLQQK